MVPLSTVDDALALAPAAGWSGRGRRETLPIRSLCYFSPGIDELLQTPLPAGYADYLRRKIAARKRSRGDSSE